MSGNHYSRQVQHLEALLSSKLKQVSLLESEHQLLRHKEAALQNAIHSIEGPLALVRASLLVKQDQQQYEQQQQILKQESGEQVPAAAAATATQAATAATAAAGGLAPDQISWGSNTHSWGQASPCTSGDAAGGVSGAAAEASGGSVTSSGGASGLAARPYKGGPELLQRINQKEDRVQRVLQQLGCCDSEGYEQLYTTQLLQKAVSDPQRMAGYLNMPKPERLQYWSEAYSRMALLLSKYDSNVSLASGSVRQQVDHLVDELFERVTVCALLDPPAKHMSCFMFNVDTHEFERYPDNWWHQVAQGMDLSAQDKAALQLVWTRVKAGSQQLTQEWEQLQQQLQQQQFQQLQRNKRFERDIQQLPGLLHTLTVAEQSRMLERQQQQQQQQSQQQLSPANQQLQQQWSPANQQLQQQLSPANEQHQQQLLPANQQHQQQWSPANQQQQWSSANHYQQQEQLALDALHTQWQQEDVCDLLSPLDGDLAPLSPTAADALADDLIAQLEAELQQEQALQQQVLTLQQQQAGGWGRTLSLPKAAAAAAAAAVPPPPPAALGVPCAVPPELQALFPNGASTPPGSAAVSNSSMHQHNQQQQQLSPAAGLSSAAATRTPSPHSSSRVGSGSQCGGRGPSSGGGVGGGFAVHEAPGAFTKLEEAEEVLLQDGTEQRRQLEVRLQAVTNKMKVLHYCLVLQVTNCLTKRQLAAMCVHSHPFVFDVEMICQALDDMGWD